MKLNLPNSLQMVPVETGNSEEKRRLHGNLLSPVAIKRRGHELMDLCKKTSPNKFQGKFKKNFKWF